MIFMTVGIPDSPGQWTFLIDLLKHSNGPWFALIFFAMAMIGTVTIIKWTNKKLGYKDIKLAIEQATNKVITTLTQLSTNSENLKEDLEGIISVEETMTDNIKSIKTKMKEREDKLESISAAFKEDLNEMASNNVKYTKLLEELHSKNIELTKKELTAEISGLQKENLSLEQQIMKIQNIYNPIVDISDFKGIIRHHEVFTKIETEMQAADSYLKFKTKQHKELYEILLLGKCDVIKNRTLKVINEIDVHFMEDVDRPKIFTDQIYADVKKRTLDDITQNGLNETIVKRAMLIEQFAWFHFVINCLKKTNNISSYDYINNLLDQIAIYITNYPKYLHAQIQLIDSTDFKNKK